MPKQNTSDDSFLDKMLERMEAESDVYLDRMLGFEDDSNDLGSHPPRVREIVEILKEHPLLVEPTLKWLKLKIGEINIATLNVLYSQDELDELYNRLDKHDAKVKENSC